MILGKYKIIRVLGKGAYGKVELVESTDGEHFAIKSISKEGLAKEPFLEDYLKNQIECMLDLNSPYIMELLEVDEDEKNRYLICEYCDGGDLLNYQARLPNKVYKIDEAVDILAQVILGLEELHKAGYLHRDIKLQNILIKNEYGKKLVKLADFGFAKKDLKNPDTVLGTEPYMSPEIFSQDIYSFEVDMWAFGVVFYYMLNLEFPFKFSNVHAASEQKRIELVKQRKMFSYKQWVLKSRKKLQENCTEQIEDLFEKIFTLDVEERMNFISIREHPVFAKKFPKISEESRIVYKNKIDSSMRPIRNSLAESDPKRKKKKNPSKKPANQLLIEYKEQIAHVESLSSRYDALLEFEEEIIDSSRQVIAASLLLSYRYGMAKLSSIMLEEFIEQEMTLAALKVVKPHLKWDQFCHQNKFVQFLKHYKRSLTELKNKVVFLSKQCQKMLSQISQTNPFFKESLTEDVNNEKFMGNFEQSFHVSTRLLYKQVRLQYGKSKKQKYLRVLLLVIMSHVAWNLCHDSSETLLAILKPYFSSPNSKNLSEFKHWACICSTEQLKMVIQALINQYFERN